MLARVVSRVVAQPLTTGNQIQPLVNGDKAFPAMLTAIDSAQKSISLSTYIFDNDKSGKQFAAALQRAVKRGVAVRVLIDATGARYSWPSIIHELKRANVPVARFLPSLAPWRVMMLNLRNHRKLLALDGQTAFTGGMNIRHGNVLADNRKAPSRTCTFALKARLWPNCRRHLPTIGRSPPAKRSMATSGSPSPGPPTRASSRGSLLTGQTPISKNCA